MKSNHISANKKQEHIVQWHPTILSKLAVVPQRYLDAYGNGDNDQSRYKDGDLVVRFPTCDLAGQNTCEAEAEVFSRQWQTVFRASRQTELPGDVFRPYGWDTVKGLIGSRGSDDLRIEKAVGGVHGVQRKSDTKT